MTDPGTWESSCWDFNEVESWNAGWTQSSVDFKLLHIELNIYLPFVGRCLEGMTERRHVFRTSDGTFRLLEVARGKEQIAFHNDLYSDETLGHWAASLFHPIQFITTTNTFLSFCFTLDFDVLFTHAISWVHYGNGMLCEQIWTFASHLVRKPNPV